MARRDQDRVSLFPFLSVLSCVIGTLALLIAALAFTQIASDLLVTEPGRGDSEIAEGAGSADPSSPDARARGQRALLAADLEGVRAQLRALGFDPDAPRAERTAVIDARRSVLALREDLPELEETRRDLEARRTGLESLVPDALKPGTEEAGIALLPSGRGDSLRPYFVECRESVVRFHDPESGESRALDLEDPLSAGRFERFLSGIRQEPGNSLVFLIRPDGVETYRKAVRRAGSANVRHAKLPLPGFGPLDFSAL